MDPQGKGWPRPDIEVQASDPEPLTRIVQVDSVEVTDNCGCEWPLLPDRCGAVIRCNCILMRVTDQGRSFNARGNLGKGLKLAEATLRGQVHCESHLPCTPVGFACAPPRLQG